MLTLKVDFNAARDGCVRGLERETTADAPDDALVVGASALLDDGEGNQALGTVQRIENGLIFAEVDWSSWGKIFGRTVVITSPTPGRVDMVPSFSEDLLQPAV
jgi:hypothetical protein